MVVSDDFNRADGPIGANWTQQGDGTLLILSNCATNADTGHFALAYWASWAGGADQLATITLINTGVGFNIQDGVTVRASGTSLPTANFYFAEVDFNSPGLWNYRLGKMINGGITFLSTVQLPLSDGDTLTIRVVGTELVGFRNWVEFARVVDTDLLSGSLGIYNNDDDTPRITSWQGGDAPRYLPRV